jgi:hypothetical protein
LEDPKKFERAGYKLLLAAAESKKRRRNKES